MFSATDNLKTFIDTDFYADRKMCVCSLTKNMSDMSYELDIYADNKLLTDIDIKHSVISIYDEKTKHSQILTYIDHLEQSKFFSKSLYNIRSAQFSNNLNKEFYEFINDIEKQGHEYFSKPYVIEKLKFFNFINFVLIC